MDERHGGVERILREWTEAMNAQGLATKTIAERVRTVRALCTDMDTHPQEVTSYEIARWVGARHSLITKWCYHTHLRSFFRWMQLVRLRPDDPMIQIARPKRPKYRPRPVDADQVFEVLELPLRKRTRAMIMLAAFAGLRIHEISKIHGQDYNARTGTLTVQGKGGHVRDIPLHSALQAFFADFPADDWWFPSPINPGPIQPNSVGYTIKRAFAKAGIKMTAHQLRHTFATELLAAGADVRIVQELMRHESIQSTALYANVSHDQQTQTLEKLHVPGPHMPA